MSAPGTLSYQVFISDPIPFAGADKTPDGDPRIFSSLSSTLIMGERDAVLVDPPMTAEQAERVARWIETTGKRLEYIFVTHGHGDHWFGTAPLMSRFPGALVVASPGTIEVMRQNASPEVRAQIWDKNFPGQIPETPVSAQPVPGNSFELEHNELRVVEVGHTDTDNSTVLHAPSIGLVVAGDVVYNGVHLYLAEAADGGFRAWESALDTVAELEPAYVVAGHKNKTLGDDPSAIDETRRYLRDAEANAANCDTAIDFFHTMRGLHPDRLNPSALWFWGAQPLFG
jgi:glyoxylase-like metal-dependent hydrolase (beta-lactamase superfamily II)